MTQEIHTHQYLMGKTEFKFTCLCGKEFDMEMDKIDKTVLKFIVNGDVEATKSL